ncbi:hypothetical protein TCAL_06905 [Tigriopus californicus]|uniref:Charged multivesicular body protein 3 n=1 Tax=Tigriopus californicus TaxID=6832 RepID=A0A553PL76_TIGCA|nr:charged multivesicular body protein 3-like [Tigriopus californicus]TRY78428.1 hypothetical protein TCAL_06905 [Tigriopus californicus]|eukprot:TCALIF_06905-PA protein Name:"Similar to chmp3 Charged multivesicular body protein 3 (Xenopus tropicalis)" AED:0.05 eAED:0.05 QI:2/1/1/1/0.5/0.66/3/146/223
MGLFGKSKTPDPKLMVQEWSKGIRKEGYTIDRQINAIKREELKALRSAKMAAKKGDKDSARVLAKEIVNARKSVSKLYTAKAHLSSIENGMKAQAAQLKMAGSLAKSADVMKAMQQLIKIPELQKTMQDMSKEMMKAGIIEEMMDDTMESLEDGEDMEESVQLEVDKVLSEVLADTNQALSKAGRVPEASIDLPEPVEDEEEAKVEVEEDLEEMQERLQALRN